MGLAAGNHVAAIQAPGNTYSPLDSRVHHCSQCRLQSAAGVESWRYSNDTAALCAERQARCRVEQSYILVKAQWYAQLLLYIHAQEKLYTTKVKDAQDGWNRDWRCMRFINACRYDIAPWRKRLACRQSSPTC